MKYSLLGILLSLSTLSCGQNQDTCDLDCLNGGTCDNSTEADQQICSCPSHVSGDLCEIDEGSSCGANTCYHGSECVHSESGGPYCDCTATVTPGKHYAGRFCEYEATTYCGADQHYFCVNGGACVDQGNGVFLCDCPLQWTGPSCEFESENPAPTQKNCTLDCWNGGTCRKDSIDGTNEDEPMETERCVCPPGFTGAKCEHPYEECGNGEHMCLHGSKCVPPKNSEHPVWTCECDDTQGKFCQHHRTSTCTSSDAANNVYEGAASFTFCVNDGICTEFIQDGKGVPGCTCPKQYTGAHCELLLTETHITTGQPPVPTEKSSVGWTILLVMLCIVFVTLTTAVFIRLRGLSEMDKTAIIEAANNGDEASKWPMMEEVDFEDEAAMEEIELL